MPGERSSAAARLIALALGSVVLVCASALLGPTRIPLASIFADPPSDAFWRFRAPRTLLAAAAGAALALGGAVYQTLFRNPLAEPYLLGIASGASLGAALGFLAGVGGHWLGVPRLGLLALAGALAAMMLVLALAQVRGGRDMTRLLLAGVCVMFLCNAGIMLATFFRSALINNDIVVWLMGSLAVLRPRAALEIVCVLLPVLALILAQHRALDLLAMGDWLAASRGVRVERVVWGAFLAIGVLTAVVVANCGPIGFVGLMAPHLARYVVGPRALPLALASVFVGAGFLAACDGVARAMLVYELPVGVVTNVLGAVFFLFLMFTGRGATRAVR